MRSHATEPPRVTIGLPVYDHTRGYLGRVNNVFGAIFSIEMDGANVWLDRSVVAGIIPDESIVLNIDRADITGHRLDVTPAA